LNNGPLTVTDSTFSGNGGHFGGGIANGGTATVTSSTFSRNATAFQGGGIYNYAGGNLALPNSTLSANSASLGGGGICNVGTVTVAFSTISGNSTDSSDGGGGIAAGGGPCFAGAATGVTTLAGTILANSSGGNCVGDVPTDGGYNISSDASCGFAGTSLLSTDPMLGSLDDNGGRTQTMALLAGSPAVNRIPVGASG